METNENVIKFEIYSSKSIESVSLHCQGRVRLDNYIYTNQSKISVADIKRRCIGDDGEKYYPIFKKMGFSYGESFKTIKEVYKNSEEVLVSLELPQSINEQDSNILFSTLIMDGALQSSMIMGMEEQDREIHLPFSVENLNWYNAIPPKCFAYITRTGELNQFSKIKKYSLYILDEEGNILIEFVNFTKKIVPIADKSDQPYLVCAPVWKEEKLVYENSDINLGDTLILSSNLSLYEEWRKRIGSDRNLVFVTPGTKFTELGDLKYTINPSCYEDYEKLWHSLKRQDVYPDNLIQELSTIREDNYLYQSFYPVVYMVQSFIKEMKTRSIRLLYVYENLEDSSYPYYAGIKSLLKTIVLEHNNFKCSSVELDSKMNLTQRCMLELFALAKETSRKVKEVQWRGNNRYVGNLVEHDIVSSRESLNVGFQKKVYILLVVDLEALDYFYVSIY
ncbi:polyketide synthase dehydratase domain-containing protein [Bacillus cereus]